MLMNDFFPNLQENGDKLPEVIRVVEKCTGIELL